MSKKKIACFAAAGTILVIGTKVALAMPEAVRLVPPPIGLPAPAGFMELVQLLTFYMHLIAVNIVLGSILIAVIDRPASWPLPKWELTYLPKVLALAVNFAIAPFLFLQVGYGSFLYPSMVLMAVWWLSVFLLVMFAYYGLYVGNEAIKSSQRTVSLVLVALLLLLTAFFLTNLSTLMLRPDHWALWYNKPHGTILNIVDPSLFPRYLHILTATLAIGGLTMAWRARISKRCGKADAVTADQRVRRGLAWFFYCSLVQLLAGPLFLFSLPSEVRSLFLGQSLVHTVSLVLVLAGLALALHESRQGNLKRVSLGVLGIVLVMVCVRSMVRDAMLRPYIETIVPATTDIIMPRGQNIALGLFLVCIVLASITIYWMLRVYMSSLRRTGDTGQEG